MIDVLGKRPSEIAYLAGAGVSIPPPSALPGVAAFISALSDAVTDNAGYRSAIRERVFSASALKRFEGDFLRFEAVMGCIMLTIDPEFRVLRVYSDCISPNAYHFYLAEQLERGAVVFTTNFDNLIEVACQTRGIDYSLVVTDEEFAAFSADPASFGNPIIKLHGGFDVLDVRGARPRGAVNVKATLEQVGSVYLSDGSDHLTAALAAMIKSRHLIVMGYSGCDDFDIMPCLMKEYPSKGITWIDHSDQRIEVLSQPPAKSPDLPPYRLLAAYGKGSLDVTVIRGSTAEILDIAMNDVAYGRQFDWTRIFAAWSGEHLASETHRRLLLGQIMAQIERFEESVKIFEGVSRDMLSERQRVVLSLTLGNLYVSLNDTARAILYLSEIAESEQEIDGVSLKGAAYYNLARVNTAMGLFTQAKVYLNAAMKIFERAGDMRGISDGLHEWGRICLEAGDHQSAIKSLQSAVRLSQGMGHVAGTAIGFVEISRALLKQGKLDEAEVYTRKAISMFTLEGNQAGLGGAHHALGYLLSERKDWQGAVEEFKRAIEYERSAGAKLDLAHSLHSLGDMYIGLKKLNEAKECLEEAILIKREINDKEGLVRSQQLLAVIEQIKTLGLV